MVKWHKRGTVSMLKKLKNSNNCAGAQRSGLFIFWGKSI
ncbi:MAG: hypothetical protein K0R93_3696 [Anaerosolibacter sp.]|jgi:hypothetical protein|nr:hypothetical protein [Anaerosolibacter sp.]